MSLPRELGRLLALVATLALTGCGEQVARPTGRVVDSGTPVARATVRFDAGCESCQGSFLGVTDADGYYRLDYGIHPGLPPGPAEVTVSRALLPDGSPLPPGEEGRYLLETGRAELKTNVYRVELASGSQTFDFDVAEGASGED